MNNNEKGIKELTRCIVVEDEKLSHKSCEKYSTRGPGSSETHIKMVYVRHF